MACRLLSVTFFVIAGLARCASAADTSVAGTVRDQLGAPIAGADVALLRDGQRVGDTTSDAHGEFSFASLPDGRYQVEAVAAGFELSTSDALFVAGRRATLDVSLQIGAVAQHVVVTAAAELLSQSQVGASVTVVDSALFDSLGNTDLVEPLRTIPGAAVVQNGGRGGTGRGVRLVTRGLVVAQIVVTCVLLVGSLLQVRSILAQERIDYGYDTGRVLHIKPPRMLAPAQVTFNACVLVRGFATN
jgi:hypothetical protein